MNWKTRCTALQVVGATAAVAVVVVGAAAVVVVTKNTHALPVCTDTAERQKYRSAGARIAVLAAVLLLMPFVFACGCGTTDPWAQRGARLPKDLSWEEPVAQRTVLAPPNGAILPRDLAAPRFSWEGPASGQWVIRFQNADGGPAIVLSAAENPWVPSKREWKAVTARGNGRPIAVTVLEITDGRVTSRAETRFSVSADPFAATIFYQEIPVPFGFAAQNTRLFRWRAARPDSYGPPATVMQDMPYCANCHIFSDNGKTFALDIDYRGDKGGCILADVGKRMNFTRREVISWNSPQGDQEPASRGLFAKISPAGEYVMASVKERPFLVKIDDPAYSQLFFPLSGQLAYYARRTGTIQSLPGADNPDVVQTCPAWSPDGQSIAFARGRAPETLRQALGPHKFLDAAPGEDIHTLNRKYRMRFDLWHVPFNNGNGGAPKPLAGASGNGSSNYFPRYSPDGRWIVFCRSETGLVSQPGSRLVMIPAGGGTPRVMRCNRRELNSWHSFAPNGRWLVFSSKTEESPYTRVFLTHIDENGEDAPAVLLHRLGTSGYAAILPEAVALERGAFQSARLLEP